MAGKEEFVVHRGSIKELSVNKLSTGNPLGNVVAAIDTDTAVVAFGRDVFQINTRRSQRAINYNPDEGTAFANPFEDVNCQALPHHGNHSDNIVSITCQATNNTRRLATIDHHGNTIVSTLDGTTPSLRLTPPSLGLYELGWAGVALSPTESTMTATALQFKQTVNLYDSDKCIRSMHSVHPLQSLSYMKQDNSHSMLLVTTEGNQVSMWDPRMQEKGGCVARVMPSAGMLYSCATAKGKIVVGGTDRVMYVYDVRKWSTLGAWKGALKFDIAHTFFSGGMEGPGDVCFAGAKVDGEFACGAWSVKYEKTSRLDSSNFRGDGRWIGMAQIPGRDDFFGVTTSGTLYTLCGAKSLQPATVPVEEHRGVKRTHGPEKIAEGEGHKEKTLHLQED